MARLDHKKGRFDVEFESDEIDGALHGYQGIYGQSVLYYRFLRDSSQFHDVYGEPTGSGRIYEAPEAVPVLSVVREEGSAEQLDGGLYWTDTLHLSASFAQLSKAGLSQLDIVHGRYLNDRLGYDGRIWKVTRIAVLGQIRRRDFIVGVDAVQMKGPDLVEDPQFADWSRVDPDIGDGSTIDLPDWTITIPDIPTTLPTGDPVVKVFTQNTPASTWIIAHALGYRPHVTLLDQHDQEVYTDVIHLDENTISVVWSKPTAGTALLT